MKTKYWIILLAVLLLLSAGTGALLLIPGEKAVYAELTSHGERVCTVDLRIDQEFTVTAPDGGTNTITVRDGKIAVTAATCPDHYCMNRGYCDGGAQIVCLPDRMVIRFLGTQAIDAMVG